MIVLDASVLTGYLDARDAHHDRAMALLTREVDDNFAVNLVTFAEILVAPSRTGRRDIVLSMLADLEGETLQFPEGSVVTLTLLRAETLLKMPDCCVLLSALDRNARLASFDDRLVKAAQARGVDVADSWPAVDPPTRSPMAVPRLDLGRGHSGGAAGLAQAVLGHGTSDGAATHSGFPRTRPCRSAVRASVGRPAARLDRLGAGIVGQTGRANRASPARILRTSASGTTAWSEANASAAEASIISTIRVV